MSNYANSDAPAASIQILDGSDAFNTLRGDLVFAGPVYCWTYLIDLSFWDSIMTPHLEHSDVYVLTDHRQRPHAHEIVTHSPRSHFWTWATNRMLHEKTFLFPNTGIVWIGSQNMTRGSWTLSKNRAVRIHSHPLLTQMLNEWTYTRSMSRPVLPIVEVNSRV